MIPAASKMELLMTVTNLGQPFSIALKSSILDVLQI